MEQDEFPIRADGRTQLAVCYFHHLNCQAAYRKLQQWIDHSPHLRERLDATSSNPRCRMYMPAQVRLIVAAIVEP